MELSKMQFFKMTRGKLGWLGERQKVLAQNVANADTPDYRSRDLKPLDFKRQLASTRRLHQIRTSNNHLRPGVPSGDHRIQRNKDKELYEVNPDGNSVVLEEQMMRVADTRMQYQLATNLYQKNVSMFRMVLGGGGR